MHARVFEDQWRQFRSAVDDVRERCMAARSGAGAGSRVRAGLRSLADYACRRGIHRQVLAGVAIMSAILGATYLAAATLVNGAASHSQARAARAMVLQQAAANYRQARAVCQSIGASARESCIADAHAEESRARRSDIGAAQPTGCAALADGGRDRRRGPRQHRDRARVQCRDARPGQHLRNTDPLRRRRGALRCGDEPAFGPRARGHQHHRSAGSGARGLALRATPESRPALRTRRQRPAARRNVVHAHIGRVALMGNAPRPPRTQPNHCFQSRITTCQLKKQ